VALRSSSGPPFTLQAAITKQDETGRAMAGSRNGEHASSAAERRQEWSWRPSSGEGSASALNKLRRMERVKRTWREVRGSHPVRDEHTGDE
jgi:hypothetical protein